MWRKMFYLALTAGILACSLLPGKGSAAAKNQGMIAIREAAESLGAKVMWKSEDKSVSVILGAAHWKITPGSNRSLLGGTPYTLRTAAVTGKDGTLCVPIESFNRALDVQAEWTQGRWSIRSEDIKGQGMYLMTQLRKGNWYEVRQLMDESLAAVFPDQALERYRDRLVEMYGLDWSQVQADTDLNSVHKNARIIYQNPRSETFGLELRFNQQGLLDDLALLNKVSDSYVPPSYDHPDHYTEEEVVVGQSPLLLPGTLTIPVHAEGKIPAVVLVHGSGPNDRDESSGGGKMFRDLAVGLANEGVAVLRYEKRTREYPNRSASPVFTVKEETIDDAVSAVNLLREDERIDPKQIYVLGHSQGGMLVPRIIEADKTNSIAGAAVLSAPSGSMEDLMLQQYQGILNRAVASGAPEDTLNRMNEQVEHWQTILQLLNDTAYSKENLPSYFPLSNAYWWYDFRNYSGPLIARSQNVRLYIMQGENDVQVPLSNMKVWRSALNGRGDVQYKTYPGLNHMYVYYSKSSTGEEYKLPGNVPIQVAMDLAEWIHLEVNESSKNGEVTNSFMLE